MNTNKDIKFRAWNTNFLTMFTFFYLTSKGEVLIENSDSKTSSNEQVEGIKQGRPSTPKDFILMQYTGLKDKNGKEIYEGDIIRPKLSVKDMMKAMLGERIENYSIEKFEVCWSEGCFELYDADNMYAGDLKQVYDGCEVLGNIYENPELLEGDKYEK